MMRRGTSARKAALSGYRTAKDIEGREGGGRLPRFVTAVRDFPGFVVDDLEQVEGVEAEVHRAAGGVEHADVARVFQRTVRDVDRLLEQLFLAQAVLWRQYQAAVSPGLRKISVGRRTR